MKLTLTIEMDNAAFGVAPRNRGRETNRILRDLGERLFYDGARRGDEGKLRDLNGNTVGAWSVTE